MPIRYSTTFTSSDKSFISNIRTIADGRSYALFADEPWDGSRRNIEVILPSTLPLYPDFSPKDVQIELRLLSPTMYAYYLDLQYNTNVYGGPLASASSINGNVEQGLGAFCFFTKSVLEIPLP